MQPEKFTTPSFDSSEMHDAALPSLDLSFPDGEGFRSPPPRVSLAQVIRRSHELRQWFPHGVPTSAERWQAKTTEEFRLW